MNKNPSEQAVLSVAEGIHGTWYYHLWVQPKNSSGGKALCGAQVMVTSIPMSAWGTRTHLNERWCSLCKKLTEPRVDPQAVAAFANTDVPLPTNLPERLEEAATRLDTDDDLPFGFVQVFREAAARIRELEKQCNRLELLVPSPQGEDTGFV